jgi:hypothetical protein
MTVVKFMWRGVRSSRVSGAIMVASLCVDLLSGCSAVEWIGIHFLYEKVEFPESQVLRDQPYREGSSPEHRLDLFSLKALVGLSSFLSMEAVGTPAIKI